MTQQDTQDEFFMRLALEYAAEAARHGEVPIGAVIVHEGKVIAACRNEIEETQNPAAHAELLVIQEAAKVIGNRRLLDTTIYVTLEPCAMCSGAIVLARIPRLVFGAGDPKAGASGTLYSITEDSRLNHRCEVLRGVLADECVALLKGFFATLRREKKKNGQ